MALPYIAYSEAYDFYTGSELKNMTTIVAIRTPKKDKNVKDRANRKVPEKRTLRFYHGSFLASTICLWWAAI